MNAWVERFDLAGPLVVAPMGGGPTTVDLVVATCEAGALGSLAAAYLTPQQIEVAVTEVRKRTSRPYAINLFTPMPQVEVSPEPLARALDQTRKFRARLGIADPTAVKAPFHPDFEQQFECVLKARPQVFSFVFGGLDPKYLKACREAGIYTLGTATSLNEGLELEQAGVDAVAAQGVEAGGHRGLFRVEGPDPEIGTLALTRTLSAKLRIPVIAAGGLMNGSDIAQALQAGASAAMLGTAFLLCPEAGTSAPYRAALARQGQITRLTRAFSGRLARGIENEFMREVGPHPEAILPFPAQNSFTRDIRTQASARGESGLLSLWAGTGLSRMRPMGAAELVKVLLQETRLAKPKA